MEISSCTPLFPPFIYFYETFPYKSAPFSNFSPSRGPRRRRISARSLAYSITSQQGSDSQKKEKSRIEADRSWHVQTSEFNFDESHEKFDTTALLPPISTFISMRWSRFYVINPFRNYKQLVESFSLCLNGIVFTFISNADVAVLSTQTVLGRHLTWATLSNRKHI